MISPPASCSRTPTPREAAAAARALPSRTTQLKSTLPQFRSCRTEIDGAHQTRSTLMTDRRSEEHTSELQSLMRISYAVVCLKKKKPRIIPLHYTNKHHT